MWLWCSTWGVFIARRDYVPGELMLSPSRCWHRHFYLNFRIFHSAKLGCLCAFPATDVLNVSQCVILGLLPISKSFTMDASSNSSSAFKNSWFPPASTNCCNIFASKLYWSFSSSDILEPWNETKQSIKRLLSMERVFYVISLFQEDNYFILRGYITA